MECQVNIEPGTILKRDNRLLIVTLLHVGRAIVFMGLSIALPENIGLFAFAGLLELFAALWLRSLRMEAWGLALGFALVHLFFPATLEISILACGVISLISIIEITILGMLRLNGHFSYVTMGLLEPEYEAKVSPVEKMMFNLTLLGQSMKALLVFMGLSLLIGSLTILDPIPWLPFVPWIPLTLAFGVLDIFCIIGLLQGRDWAFQLTITMACLGLVETILAWSPMLILIAIWIVMLFLPCWVKSEFYRRVRLRMGLQNDTAGILE